MPPCLPRMECTSVQPVRGNLFGVKMAHPQIPRGGLWPGKGEICFLTSLGLLSAGKKDVWGECILLVEIHRWGRGESPLEGAVVQMASALVRDLFIRDGPILSKSYEQISCGDETSRKFRIKLCCFFLGKRRLKRDAITRINTTFLHKQKSQKTFPGAFQGIFCENMIWIIR